MRLSTCLCTVLTFAGCVPAPHDLEGRACDDQHPCPLDLTCSLGRCTSSPGGDGGGTGGGTGGGSGGGTGGAADDGGLQNLLPNGGFELGATGGWSANGAFAGFSVQSQNVRSGALAARISPLDGGTSGALFGLVLDKDTVAPIVSGALYCVEAWVDRSTHVSDDVDLLVRHYNGSGGFEDSTTGGAARALRSVAGWQRVVQGTSTAPPFDSRVNLRFSGSWNPGESYDVDDVRMWVVVDGGACN